MLIKQIFDGKPFMTEFGIVGYSSVVLVKTDHQNILYDCGNRGCSQEIKEALKENGLTPEDITDVVISHMHFDHVGNLPIFQNAVIHMSETEWKCVNSTPDEWHCIQTRDYIKHNKSIHFVKEGDYIAEGLEVLELPGHTMGLIGIRYERTILCSDAIKNRYEMWEDRPLMAADLSASLKTQARIRKEADVVYTGHDSCLTLAEPVNREAIEFSLKFADGTFQPVVHKR